MAIPPPRLPEPREISACSCPLQNLGGGIVSALSRALIGLKSNFATAASDAGRCLHGDLATSPFQATSASPFKVDHRLRIVISEKCQETTSGLFDYFVCPRDNGG